MSEQDQNQDPSTAEFAAESNPQPGETTGEIGADLGPVGDQEPESSSSETLLGSSIQPSTVLVAGFEVSLGQAVAAAHEQSGLTVAEWNALPDQEREDWIALVIDQPKADDTIAGAPVNSLPPVDEPEAPQGSTEPDPAEGTSVQDTESPSYARGERPGFYHIDEAAFFGDNGVKASGLAVTTDDGIFAGVAPGAPVTVNDEVTLVGAGAIGRQLMQSLAAETAAVKIQDPTVTPSAAVSEQFKAELQTASATAQIHIASILEYMEQMHPRRPITDDNGARAQVRLYRALVGAINQVDTDFPVLWSAILKLFDDYGSTGQVLHEMSVFRFFEHVGLNIEERDTFRDLLNLLKVTASPQGRAIALKQVSLTKTLRHRTILEPGRQRVQAFYGQ